VSPLGESPKKVPASFPNIGNVSKKFWQVFPTLGMFQKSSGKLSQRWECSKKVLASFPNIGNGSKKFWQGFPTLGMFQWKPD